MTTIRSNPENSADPTDEEVDYLLEKEQTIQRLTLLKQAIDFEIELIDQQTERFRQQHDQVEARLEEIENFVGGGNDAREDKELGTEYCRLEDLAEQIERKEIDPREARSFTLEEASEKIEDAINDLKE